jgi:hypothetical protein
MDMLVSELAKALKAPRSLPADNLQAVDFQVLDSHIPRDEGRAKRLSLGRDHDVKCSCAPPETLGIDADASMRFSGCVIPRMNRYSRQKGTYGGHDGRLVVSKARAIEQFRQGDA